MYADCNLDFHGCNNFEVGLHYDRQWGYNKIICQHNNIIPGIRILIQSRPSRCVKGLLGTNFTQILKLI